VVEARAYPPRARPGLVALGGAVCLIESGAGIDPRARSRCGVRVRGRYVRDVRSSVRIALRSLWRWRRRCGGERQALVAYRAGSCRGGHEDYARRVTAVRDRLVREQAQGARAIRRSAVR
jgi:hypothetical protein